MKDKPIIFSAPMINALLDGRKTQTRRILKPAFGGKHSVLNLAVSGEIGKRAPVHKRQAQGAVMSREVMQQALDALGSGNDDRKLAAIFALEAELAKPAVHDGVWEALQRLIENAATLGRASQEDAVLVARHRADLLAKPAPVAQETVGALPKGWTMHAKVNVPADEPGQRIIGWRASPPENVEHSFSAMVESVPAPVAVPEGWQLVPSAPTEKMLAAIDKIERLPGQFGTDRMAMMGERRANYQAMLAAAPQPPPSVDVEAIREVIAECRNEKRGTAGDFYHDFCGEQAGEWADTLTRAIGDET